MSADGDTERGLAELRRMAEQARDLADNPAPLAALARLEAVEARRDALAEALRRIADGGYDDDRSHRIVARAALAEAGLE